MKWTKAQQEAIEVRNKNILVSAAAGSGKTAVLVERILSLLLQDRVSLDRMLIVTFSNAAASEMREKIVKAITKAIRESKGQDLSEEAFLREQLNVIHQANISTFHAFSLEVIRRYFYLIDREPDFRICDEAQRTLLQADAMDELLADLFESGEEEFLWFLSHYGQTKNENAVKEMILDTYEFIQSIPEPFAWLAEKTQGLLCTKEQFLASEVFAEMIVHVEHDLNLAKEYFVKALELLTDQGLEGLMAKCNMEVQLLEARLSELKNQSFEDMTANLSTMKFQVYRTTKEEKESYEEIKESVTALRDKGKGIVKKLVQLYGLKSMAEYVAELNETHRAASYLEKLVNDFATYYRRKKDEKKVIDFSDIEHEALKILAQEEVAAEYQEKFLHIFIDEYQDSNIVQETLINCIKRENNVFMVGDVKQSIYKFRLAEPELFIKKYEWFQSMQEESNYKIDLNQNFRSKGAVICAVNDVFQQIMKKDLSGLDYDEAAALHKGVTYEGELDYPVELHVADDKNIEDADLGEEILEMKKAEIEAFNAAKIIAQSVGKPIYDGKQEKVRSLQYRDIVVLLRGAKGTADIYRQAFMDEGIPAFVDMSDGYFDTVEIEVFLNLLRVIDNMRQDVPLLSVLRSQLFGYTVEELIYIRLHDKSLPYHEVFLDYTVNGEQEALRQKCAETVTKLAAWRKAASYMSMEDLLWRVLRETTYYEYVGAIPAGAQRQANLRAFIDKAVQFQASQMKGLFHFIRYIEAVKKQQIPTGQVKLLGEKDDVVRIMTIHKSKGLEFPMVIVGGLGKRFVNGARNSRVSFHKDVGIGLRLVDKEHHAYVKTLLQTVIEQKRRREDMAEEIRVLYVAFTRAMDKLVLLGSVTDLEKRSKNYELQGMGEVTAATCYLDFILPLIEKTAIKYITHDKLEISGLKIEEEVKLQNLADLLNQEIELKDESYYEELKSRFAFQYRYQKALALKSKFTVSELNREKRRGFYGQLQVPAFTQTRVKFTGAERGTILHKIMEHIPFQPTTKEEVTAYIAQLVTKGILYPEEAAAADASKIVAFMSSPIGRRAAAAQQLERELSFNLLKEKAGETVIVQGTIDCCFLEDEEYVLLDYKSDYVGRADDQQAIEELINGYREQLELYKEALQSIRAVKVKECYLYLFSIQKEIKIGG